MKRRNIKPNGSIAERKSRRSSGLNSIALDIPRDSISKELKLLQLGRCGGRPRGKINDWDYFPSSVQTTIKCLKLSGNEIERNNRNAFTSVANIIDDINVEKHDESNKNNR